MILLTGAVQMKGRGLLVVSFRYARMALIKSATLLNVPLRILLLVISANHLSTRLSQEDPVGTKCRWNRACCASHSFTTRCLWVPQLSRMMWRSRRRGVSLSIFRSSGRVRDKARRPWSKDDGRVWHAEICFPKHEKGPPVARPFPVDLWRLTTRTCFLSVIPDERTERAMIGTRRFSGCVLVLPRHVLESSSVPSWRARSTPTRSGSHATPAC